MTKKLTAQQIAKMKTASSWEKMLAIQKNVTTPAPKPKLTPKESQAARAARFYQKHKEKAKNQLIVYRQDFKEIYGVEYNSWLYWQKKLENNEIIPKAIPKKYSKVLRHYLINKTLLVREKKPYVFKG